MSSSILAPAATQTRTRGKRRLPQTAQKHSTHPSRPSSPYVYYAHTVAKAVMLLAKVYDMMACIVSRLFGTPRIYTVDFMSSSSWRG